jgi:hypothetical protein
VLPAKEAFTPYEPTGAEDVVEFVLRSVYVIVADPRVSVGTSTPVTDPAAACA